MEASTNNTANTTANVLVYEPVPPINPSNKEGQASTNPINPSGSLAEQAGPGLSTRQVQPIYALFDKYKSDAHQLLKKGKITEASEIYMSLAENLELKLKKRLNCAKRLLEINTQAPQTAQTKEYIVKAANILVDIAKDDRIHGPTRLKAFRSIAETKGLEDRALEIFSTFFKSQTLPGWIQDAAGDCIAPLLLAKAEDLQLWPLERIQAAEQLSQINGQEDKQAAAWASIAGHPLRTLMPHTGDRIRVAKILSAIEGQEAQAAELFELVINGSYARVFRIKAAIQLSKIPGYEAKAAEYLLQRIEDKVCTEDDSTNRMAAAKRLSEIAKQGDEATKAMAKRAWIAISKDPRSLTQNRYHLGKELLKMDEETGAEFLLTYAKDYESPGNTMGNRMHAAMRLLKTPGQEEKAAEALLAISTYAARWVQNRFSAAEKLAQISGQEEKVAAAWAAIAQDVESSAVSHEVRSHYRMKAAERLAGMKYKQSQDLAVNILEVIKQDITLKLSYRIQAAETLSRITQGTELVDFLFELVKDVKVLSFDRIEAAERLSKLVGEDRQGEIWASLLNERHSYLDVDTGFKIAKKLSKIKKYEAIAANYFIYLGRYPCLFSDSVFTYKFIKACKHLAKIPGYEGIAAELLSKKSDLIVKRLEKSKCSGTTSRELIDLYGVAAALQEIPGQEENTARIWLTTIQHTANQQDLAYIAQSLLRIPGHAEKAKTVWLYIQDPEKEKLHQAFKSMYTILSAGGLFELGETEKAVRILTTCAQDETESSDRRMLAVDNLARIPGQEAEAEGLKTNIEKVQAKIANAIVAAKNHLQNSEEKEKGVNDLLSIAKNTAVDFLQRMLAVEALCEVPELHPKAIEALDFIAKDNTLFRDKHVLAAERLSKIPGQMERARKIADNHMVHISNESRYFKI